MKNRLKGIFALMILLGGMITMTACTKTTVTTATLHYPLLDDNSTLRPIEVCFDDEAFSEERTAYDNQLAKCALVLSSSAYRYDTGVENLTALGFTQVAKFSYEPRYSGDSIGLLIGHKEVGNTTLIAVVLRGSVGAEWYSNFDIGTGIEHRGFSQSTDYAAEKIRVYLTNYKLTKNRLCFFVTGYSRGGAVANLLTKRLYDEGERAVGYTFACPMTTRADSDAGCDTLYNTVKSADLFTRVPFESWGYHRYGEDVLLGDAATEDETRDVRAAFHSIVGDEYIGFDGAGDLEDFLTQASRLAPTVEDYYERQYTVGDRELSVYDYMMLAARFLAGEDSDEDVDLLVSTMFSDYAPMSAFFMQGMDPLTMMEGGDFMHTSVADSHRFEGYIAYFT